MKKHAEINWTRGAQFIGTADSNVPIIIGQPGAEEGHAPSPMELVLLGFIGCTGMDVLSILKKKRQQLTDLKITIDSERAETHPKIYISHHLVYTAKGKDLSEKAVEDAVKLSKEKYCSVSAMLEKTGKITYEVVIEQE